MEPESLKPVEKEVPADVKAPGEVPLDQLVLLTKASLWMLIHHMEYAITKGAYNSLAVVQQRDIMSNMLAVKAGLKGWSPPPDKLKATA